MTGSMVTEAGNYIPRTVVRTAHWPCRVHGGIFKASTLTAHRDAAVNDPKPDSDYLAAFRGSFTSTLRWPQLDALCERLRAAPEGWFVYAIGEVPPQEPVSAAQLQRFIDEVDGLLRREHDEDYCGIVYADIPSAPTMIKIYDPNNLGVSCGYSDNPPLPGWVLSRIPPVDLEAARQPGGRRRWWQRLFGAG
jgi:hypothetical protein